MVYDNVSIPIKDSIKYVIHAINQEEKARRGKESNYIPNQSVMFNNEANKNNKQTHNTRDHKYSQHVQHKDMLIHQQNKTKRKCEEQNQIAHYDKKKELTSTHNYNQLEYQRNNIRSTENMLNGIRNNKLNIKNSVEIPNLQDTSL